MFLVCAVASGASPWVSLFDGATPSGWLEVTGKPFPTKSWTIEAGCLRALVVDGGFQDLRTVEEFENFEFQFEWKIAAGGNSGVKYLIDKVDEWKAKDGEGYHARGRGPEYQLVDDESNPDSRGQPAKQTGALYGVVAPGTHAARPAGEWNSSRIVVAPGRVEHWLNGVKVVEYRRVAKRSPIVLQNHHSAVWFRNLRIRQLGSAP